MAGHPHNSHALALHPQNLKQPTTLLGKATNKGRSGMTGAERGWPVRKTLVQAMRGEPERSSSRVPGQRQLRYEVKSAGNQPTDVRVIHRRNKPPAVRSRHEQGGGGDRNRPSRYRLVNAYRLIASSSPELCVAQSTPSPMFHHLPLCVLGRATVETSGVSRPRTSNGWAAPNVYPWNPWCSSKDGSAELPPCHDFRAILYRSGHPRSSP